MNPQATVNPRESAARGLQVERTALAWHRTALATMVCGGLLAREGRTAAVVQFAGFLAVAAGAVLYLHATRRHDRALAAVAAGRSPAAPRTLRAVWALAIGLCAAVLLALVARLAP